MQWASETQITLDLLPKRGLPSIDLELSRFEHRYRHGRIRLDGLICRHVFRAQLQFPLPSFTRGSQAVHFQAQVRQDIIVDDVIEKDSIRVEGLLRQDYAVIKRFVVVANGSAPTFQPPDGRVPKGNSMPLARDSL